MNKLLNTSVLFASLLLPGAALAEGAFLFIDAAYAWDEVGAVEVTDYRGTGSLGGGYMFSDLLGTEVGYVSYGEIVASAVDTVDGSGWLAGGRIQVPVGYGLGAFGRFGLHHWEITETVNGTEQPAEDGDGLYFGLGGSFTFRETIDAYVAWTRYRMELSDEDVTYDVTYDHLGVGLQVRF